MQVKLSGECCSPQRKRLSTITHLPEWVTSTGRTRDGVMSVWGCYLQCPSWSLHCPSFCCWEKFNEIHPYQVISFYVTVLLSLLILKEMFEGNKKLIFNCHCSFFFFVFPLFFFLNVWSEGQAVGSSLTAGTKLMLTELMSRSKVQRREAGGWDYGICQRVRPVFLWNCLSKVTAVAACA